jgi:hypothetical protein
VATALDVVGAVVATRKRLVGEPLGIVAPRGLPPALVLAAWGTALSGPLTVDGVLLASTRPGDHAIARSHLPLRVLGGLRLIGVLSEPATWGRRRPRWVVLLNVAQLGIAARLIHLSTAPGSLLRRADAPTNAVS